jgi:regulatory protein
MGVSRNIGMSVTDLRASAAAVGPLPVAAPTTVHERSLDPELARRAALDVAWLALDRRERTEAELRRLLAGKRVEPALIEEVVGELRAGGYVDDAGYARRFAADRRSLDGWGAERIRRRLQALGVVREHVEAAVAERGHAEELEAALALLAGRYPVPPATPREAERALGVLVRRGYALDAAYEALRRYARVELDGEAAGA